jgi:hypothetical protein
MCVRQNFILVCQSIRDLSEGVYESAAYIHHCHNYMPKISGLIKTADMHTHTC